MSRKYNKKDVKNDKVWKIYYKYEEKAKKK